MGSMWVNQDGQQWLCVGLAKKKKLKMLPKKSFQPLPGQKKLRFGGQPLHTNDDEPKSVPESERVAGSASTSDNNSEKKKRKFLSQWLKTYGWLKYDEEKILCTVMSALSLTETIPYIKTKNAEIISVQLW